MSQIKKIERENEKKRDVDFHLILSLFIVS